MASVKLDINRNSSVSELAKALSTVNAAHELTAKVEAGQVVLYTRPVKKGIARAWGNISGKTQTKRLAAQMILTEVMKNAKTDTNGAEWNAAMANIREPGGKDLRVKLSAGDVRRTVAGFYPPDVKQLLDRPHHDFTVREFTQFVAKSHASEILRCHKEILAVQTMNPADDAKMIIGTAKRIFEEELNINGNLQKDLKNLVHESDAALAKNSEVVQTASSIRTLLQKIDKELLNDLKNLYINFKQVNGL